MRKSSINLMLLIFVLFSYFELKAQPPVTDSTPAKCRWNLTQPIFEEIDIKTAISYARATNFPGNLCRDVMYLQDNESCSTNVNDCDPGNESLIYDAYYPKHDYTALKLPAIILGHPGGFSDCSDYQQTLMFNLCTALAKRGFVVFNIEYRRGRIKDDRNDDYRCVQHYGAFYKGIQDARGAIRSVIQRERDQYNVSIPDKEPYRIDTTRMFLGGASAGGVQAFNAAWYSNNMVYDIFPTASGAPTIDQVYGPIDADYYYGPPTIEYHDNILAIAALWAGIGVPYSYFEEEENFFDPALLTPFIAFHGLNDPTFRLQLSDEHQYEIFSPVPDGSEINYHSTSRCLITSPYTLAGDGEEPDLINSGPLLAYSIFNRLDLDLAKELYIDEDMGHGLDAPGDPAFDSEFGTGLDTGPEVHEYMSQRIATFFQAVMQGATRCQINPSYFVECENKRVKCNPPPPEQTCETDVNDCN